MPVPVAPSVPRPIAVGPEMAALAPFFPDVAWEGSIREGGMGPSSPEMVARGHGSSRLIQDGRWIAGDYEQEQFLLDGTYVLTWELHFVVGWVPEAGEYRATINDNYGHAAVMRGAIEGDRLVFEMLGDWPVRLRMTWERAAEVIRWRNEASPAEGQWLLIEEYDMRPVARA